MKELFGDKDEFYFGHKYFIELKQRYNSIKNWDFV
jgi:hypothetical protein